MFPSGLTSYSVDRVYTADIADAVEITDSVMRMNTPFYSVSFIRFLQMNVYAYCTLVSAHFHFLPSFSFSSI